MLLRSKRAFLFDDAGYKARMKTLFGSSLIGYYVGDEPVGASVALDDSGRDFHGAYTGVTLGQPGIGDGLTCPLYDGAADYMQPPAGFRAVINWNALTVMAWCKVSGVSVWTDGLSGTIFYAQDTTGTQEIFLLRKNTVNNTIRMNFTKGTTANSQNFTTSTLDFFHFGVTLSATQMILYFNGIGQTPVAVAGTLSGNAVGLALIGAASTTPVQVLNGFAAHVCVLNKVATPAEMAAAAAI